MLGDPEGCGWESRLSSRQPLPRVPAVNRPCVRGEAGTRGMQPQRIGPSDNGPDLAGEWASIRPG